MRNNSDSKGIRVVQITDPHLFCDERGTLLKLNTQESLSKVIDLIRKNETEIDLMLATGDITADGSPEAYQRFHQLMGDFNVPWRWIPGNHDVLSTMRAVSSASGASSNVVHLDNWQIIFLNTPVSNRRYGWLAESELDHLESCLSQSHNGKFYNIICLHHNPIPSSAQWMKEDGLHNDEDFIRLIKRFDSVRAVLFGHIHQQLDIEKQGIRFLCTPSTSLQFKPNVVEFELDKLNPGYRWLELHSDGSIDTDVLRVTDHEFIVDFASEGY